MYKISTKELFLWINENTNNKEEKSSIYLLLDLVAGVSKRDLSELRFNSEDYILLKENLDNLFLMWREHISLHRPIQYITGSSYWRNFQLDVSENVLIPRPETEQLRDSVFNLFSEDYNKKFFVDLGTGSGALAIALASSKSNWVGIATDIDQNALLTAEANFRKVTNNSNLSFLIGNWWDPLTDFAGNIDFAISNPPYIPSDVYEKLPLGIKNFEPKIALNGGLDGLLHIRKIIKGASRFLKKEGWLLLENHHDQSQEIKNLLEEFGFDSVKTIFDYFGIGRFTIGRYK